MVTGVFFSSPVLVIAGSCWLLSVELQGADHLPEGGSTSGPESLICPCFTALEMICLSAWSRLLRFSIGLLG
jgi:hypothetical protein